MRKRKVISENILRLDVRHGNVGSLDLRLQIVFQIIRRERIDTCEIMVERISRREFQPFQDIIVQSDTQPYVIIGVGLVNIPQLPQGYLLCRTALARQQCGRALGVEGQSLHASSVRAGFLRGIGEVDACKGTQLRRQIEVKIAQQTVTAEIGTDHDARLVIDTGIDHVSDIVCTACQLHIGLRQLPDTEGILPPVRTVVVESVERVLRNTRQTTVWIEHLSVAPQIVVGTVVVGIPAVRVLIGMRIDKFVGKIVIVGSPLALCQEQGDVTFSLSHCLHRRTRQPGERL